MLLMLTKSIATFKLREGMKIGCKVTLRKSRMSEFLNPMTPRWRQRKISNRNPIQAGEKVWLPSRQGGGKATTAPPTVLHYLSSKAGSSRLACISFSAIITD